MIRFREGSQESRDSLSSISVITTSFSSSMDLKASSFFPATGRHSLDCESSIYSKNKGNPFADSLQDPLCKLNFKETSDFVRALPMNTKCSSQRREGLDLMGQRRLQETPSTPGRPLFTFSPGHLHRKNIPSKWDDAEKWLIGSPCYESPAHVTKPTESTKRLGQDNLALPRGDSISGVKAQSSPLSSIVACVETDAAFHGASSEVLLLKDKFTNNVGAAYPNLRYPEPSIEGFPLKNSYLGIKKDLSAAGISEIKYRDAGTDTTPLGSSMTTRCHTPNKSSPPARHNTPADRSGALDPCNACISISELNDCHFAKLSAQYDSIFSNWSSREEEEEEVSKSLRHLEIDGGRKSICTSWAAAWEEEERIKSCTRYQREEAKIQAWLNLQNAKAEAESRKFEVKIQKMRSNLEEKLMKRMANVHRRAEEWRAAVEQQHSKQLKGVAGHAQKMRSRQSSSGFSVNSCCGCFPCKNQP